MIRRLLPALVALAVVAGSAAAAVQHRASVRPAYGGDGLLTILVIGSDEGWPDRPADELRARADGLHLLAVDPAARRATVVDIPRDALVGGTKVNAHLALGGPERLVGQVAAFSGVEIDHWALTTFHGLRSMVEGMGGIDIVVERPMTSVEAQADLQPGHRTLDGADALAFSRDRKSQPRGDLDRTRNQGRLLLAAHAQIRARQQDLPTLGRLVARFLRDTHSDIPREQVLPMALLATQIAPEAILHAPLSGTIGTTSGGASIVHLAVGDTFARIAAGQVGPPAP